MIDDEDGELGPPEDRVDNSPIPMRAQVLQLAEKLVCKDRNKTHGKAGDNFKHTASLWSAYLDVEITPDQIPIMMALFKMARIKSKPKEPDNYLDILGYVSLAAEEVINEKSLDNQP